MKRRILYIGQLTKGGTCQYRMQALMSLGCNVTPFDTSGYTMVADRPISTRIAHRFNVGPIINQLNMELSGFAESLDESFDIVWVDKGKWISPDTLKTLKNRASLIAHYTADPQLVFNRSKQFTSSIGLYDLLITTKPFELNLYKQLGSKNVMYVNQSYEKSVLYPRPLSNTDRAKFGSDVTFIGRCEWHYLNAIHAATKCKCDVKVWGPKWRRYTFVMPWLRAAYKGTGLWEQDYGAALSAAKISLGLLSKRYPETTTTRTFEIPACGALMIAERTEEHLTLFEEDKEAVFFSSNDELISKISFYLRNDSLRDRIASNGHKRCIDSGYDNISTMSRVIDNIDALLRKK